MVYASVVQLHTTPEGPPFGSGLVTHWAVSGTHPDAITPQGKQASSRPQAATTATITTAIIRFMGPLLNAECSTARAERVHVRREDLGP